MKIRPETATDHEVVLLVQERAFADSRIPALVSALRTAPAARRDGRRKFDGAAALGFRAPSLRIPEPAFQVAVLPSYEPWMTGTLVYPAPFWDLDCVGLR